MARSHGIVVLSLIALGTASWLALARPDDDAPPLPDPTAPPPAATPAERADLADGRTRVEAAPRNPAPTPTLPPPDPGAVAADRANVVLAVRDRATHADLEPFAWRFVGRGLEAMRGNGKAGLVELRLPAVPGTLLVESPEHRPETLEFTPPGPDAPARRIDLFLASRAPATGVALTLRGSNGEVVTRVRIDLWQLEANAPAPAQGEDPRYEPLWKRQFEDVDGLFGIEELAAGRYALRAQAIDEAGWAAPMQPARFAFEFHGHEAVPLRAQMPLGQVLRVLQDGDETTERQISLAVRAANGEGRSIPFRSVDAAGRVATGYDVARVPGRVESLFALPPQELQLEAFFGEKALPVRRGGAAIGADYFVVTLPR